MGNPFRWNGYLGWLRGVRFMIQQKVERLLDDFEPGHSDFQVENFIVGSSGHPWTRYKQALRELATRHDGIMSARDEVRYILGSIKVEERFGVRRLWFFGRKRRIAMLKSKLARVKKQQRSRMREYCEFYRIARALKNEIGNVSRARRRELEAEAWVDKARRLAAIDLISLGGIQRSTAEFIASFPQDERRLILGELRKENRQKLLSILE
jgi:hypothetical protein